MERLANLIPIDLNQLPLSVKSYEEYAQAKIDRLNAKTGDLKGYDCKICKNKGFIYKLGSDSTEIAEACTCKKIRLSQKLLEESGLTEEIERCTFESFRTSYPYQERMKAKALDFIDSKAQAFFIGGQSGVGKTHICTAIVGEMLKKCVPVIYMSWREAVAPLKTKFSDGGKKSEEIERKYKNADVLYIDDFLKVGGNGEPSTADISVAFEIINYRYQRRNQRTVISSEMDISHINALDEALGSRISAMTGGFCISIQPDTAKNFRTNNSTRVGKRG